MTAPTIYIHSLDHDPMGIKVITKGQWTGRIIWFPRLKLVEALKCINELTELPGVYLLYGPSESSYHRYQVYIGEADPVGSRLSAHNRDTDKAFWTQTLVFTGEDLNKVHIQYLEAVALEKLKNTNRVFLVNKNQPKPPTISKMAMDDAEAFWWNVSFILRLLGIDFFYDFEETYVGQSKTNAHIKVYISGKDVYAEGIYSGEGITILKGSKAVKEENQSIPLNVKEKRDSLITNGIMQPSKDGGNFYEFIQDSPIAYAPSTAAGIILGGSFNGLRGSYAWKVISKLEGGKEYCLGEYIDAAGNSNSTDAQNETER